MKINSFIMIKIGQYNKLAVRRAVDFGLYLEDESGNEVLLPARYVTADMRRGDLVDVFVYTDSEDRPVATTDTPLATVGEVAFLEVAAVNRIGAFMDWGLMKDLLVPFREQRATMKVGGRYPVFVYLDDESKRVVGSAKIDKWIGNLFPDYRKGQKVNALVWRQTPIGMACIVDNRHFGMLYSNETFEQVYIGDHIEAYVNRVRSDGKIDLRLSPAGSGRRRSESTADRILSTLSETGGFLPLTDKSSPEEIKDRFQCSKREFKQAVGHLMKVGKISQTEAGLQLLIPKG